MKNPAGLFKRLGLLMIAAVVALIALGTAQAEHPWAYAVHHGDTLLAIAGRFGVPLEDLRRANGTSLQDTLYPGDTLFIAAHPVATQHTVARGETLQTIAGRYSFLPEQIVQQNGLVDQHTLRAGQVLLIPDLSGEVKGPGVAIARPAQGERVSQVFRISGWGQSYDNELVIQVRDETDVILSRSVAVHAEIGQIGPFSTTLVLPSTIDRGQHLNLSVSNRDRLTDAFENTDTITIIFAK